MAHLYTHEMYSNLNIYNKYITSVGSSALLKKILALGTFRKKVVTNSCILLNWEDDRRDV